MTDIVAPLTWTMNLDSVGFEVAATRAGQTLKSLSGNFTDAAASAMKTDAAINKVGMSFKDTIVTMGAFKFLLMDLDSLLLSFPKSVAKIGGEFQKMQVQMQGLSQSADEVTQKVEGMRDVAFVVDISKNAPIELKKLTDTFVKFKEAGIDPANGSMVALINSVAKFGGGADVLDRAGLALREMMGTNVVNMKELRRQLGQAIPNAMQLMAKGLGLTMEELTKKVTSGTLLSTAAVARLFQMMAIDAQGAAEKMMHTFPGALSRMTTEYHLFEKAVSDRGFLTDLTSAFSEITAKLDSPGGQKFAKDVGNSLRETVEFLMLTARWASENTELLKTMGMTLASIWGGGKLAVMVNGIKSSIAMHAEAAKKAQDEKLAAAEKDIANAERVAKTDQRLQGQAERTRDAYSKKLNAQRDQDLKNIDKSVNSQKGKLESLESARDKMVQRRAEVERRAEESRLSAFDAAHNRAKAAGEKTGNLNEQWYSKVNVADAGLATDQTAEDAKRVASIDKIASRREYSIDKLKDLEQRRDDAVQRHKDAGDERTARATDRRIATQEKAADKALIAQEKIVELEERRAQIAQKSHADAISKLEKEGRIGQAQLESLQKKLKNAGDGTLTAPQKTEQLDALRKLETEKRIAHEGELKRIAEVRERREMVQREQFQAIDKLNERREAGPQRNERGQFIKGNSKTDIAEAAKVVAAENAQREILVQTTHQEETAHLANARALQEESKQAAKAGDALAKRAVGTDPNAGAMQREIDQRKQKMDEGKTEIARLQAMNPNEVANGTTRTAPIEAQIKAQRALIATYEESAKKALQEEAAVSEATAKHTLNTEAVDRQILAVKANIEVQTVELERLKSLTIAQGRYSAATIASIEATERAIATSVKAEATAVAEAAALGQKTQKQHELTASTVQMTAAANENVAQGAAHMGVLAEQQKALHAQPALVDAHSAALVRNAAEATTTAKQTTQLAQAMAKVETLTVKAASGLAGLTRSLVTGGVYAVAFYAVIETGMWVFDKFTEKARKAEAAALAAFRAQNGQSVEGDEKFHAEELTGLNKELEDKKRATKALTEQITALNDPKSRQTQLRVNVKSGLDAEIRALELRIEQVKKNAAQAHETIQLNSDESRVNSIMSNATKFVQAKINGTEMSNNNKRINAELFAAENAEKKDEVLIKSVRARFEVMAKANSTLARVLTEEAGKKILADHAGDSETIKAGLIAAVNAQNKVMQDQERAVHINPYTDPKKETAAPTKSTMATALENQVLEMLKQKEVMSKWKKDADTLIEIRKSVMEKWNAEVAKDPTMGSARLSDRGQKLDKDGKKRNVDVAPDPKRGQQWRDNAETLDIGKEIIRLHGELSPMLASLKAEEDSYADVLNGDNLFKPSKESKEIEKVIAKLTSLKGLLDTEAGKKFVDSLDDNIKDMVKAGASFEDITAQMRAQPAHIEIINETRDLKKKVLELEIAGVTDVTEVQRILTQNIIDEERKRIAASMWRLDAAVKLTAQEVIDRKVALDNLAAFEKGHWAKFTQTTQNAVAKMADDWGKGFIALESATAGWMDKLVDGIFKGELKGKAKIKAFAMSIVEDIGKIKLKEQLSSQMSGMLDPLTKSIGGMLGIKGTGKQGAQLMPLNASGTAMNVAIVSGINSVLGEPVTPPEGAERPERDGSGALAQVAEVSGVKSEYEKLSATLKDVKTGFGDITVKGKDIFDTAGKSLSKMFDGLQSGLSGVVNGLINALSSSGGSGISAASTPLMDAFAVAGFANGGIMSSAGSMSLRKYANGGVATSPQLALFGEGSMNEAYVPLPDGRRIPVALSGGAQQGQPAPAAGQQAPAPSVHINLINQTGQQQTAATGNIKFDGRQMILDVVLSAAGQPGAFRDNFRGIVNQK